MLQAMRSKAAGVVAKVLFSVLVLSFAVWGIGDYAFLRRDDPVAIKIAGVEVKASKVQAEYQQELERLRRALGGAIDPEFVRQSGLIDRVVDRIVEQALLDRSAAKLGIAAGDDVVRARITSDPAFRGPTGQFDRFVFQQLLTQNGYNEQRYVETLRRDIPRSLVLESVAAGVRVPDLLADRIYRHRYEKRSGETVFVAAGAFADVGKPTDEQIQQIYEENKDRFTAPEYRAVSVVKVGAEELLGAVKPTEEQIREEFEARSSEFVVPERREVEQILIADEGAAKAAYDKIKGGADFLAVAREAANQTPERTKLGLYTRGELPQELSDAVFALGEGAVTEPIKSDFGWHIVRVAKVEPGKDARLDEVRERLAQEVAQRLAADQAYETAVKIDEELTRGAQLADAAKKHGLAMTKVEALDARGMGPDGAPVAVFADATDVVQRVFETAAGAVEQLVESQSGGWYIFRVDQVTPSQLRPLEDVHSAAIALWEAQQRDAKARERAEKILARVKAGATLEAAAAEHGLKPDKIPPAIRTGESEAGARVQADLAGRLFGLKPGESTLAPTRGGYHAMRLVDIVPADPAADKVALERVRGELRQQMANDLVSEYGAALRERHGVEIRREVIERLL